MQYELVKIEVYDGMLWIWNFYEITIRTVNL